MVVTFDFGQAIHEFRLPSGWRVAVRYSDSVIDRERTIDLKLEINVNVILCRSFLENQNL